MNRPVCLLTRCVLVLALCCLVVPAAGAQKKKTPAETPPPSVASQPPAPRPGQGLREVLLQFQGKATNLGTLSKVAADYIVADEEGTTRYIALSAIQSVAVVREEGEEGAVEQKITITLLAGD